MKAIEKEQKTPLEIWLKWVEQLRQASNWPVEESPIEMKQTHISVLLLGRNRVAKLKKPVDFGFLDYTTLSKRKRACEDEIRLNRRLCPDAYLGLGVVVEVDGKVAFSDQGGEIVDYCVWMKRLPEESMLDHMVAAGTAAETTMARIASRLAEFHRTAKRGEAISHWGSWEEVRRNWEENFTQTKKYINRTIDAAAFQAIESWVRRSLEQQKGLFEERMRAGGIVDGHGDVRCESISVINEKILIYDCIEFNDRFRCGDVSSEAAFLAMDLDARGRPDLGYYFSEQYQQKLGDKDLFKLLPFYRCYRAFVRGKVLSFQLDEPEFDEKEKKASAALAAVYFELARRYASQLQKPTLIVVRGLPGVGKTSVARAIASELGIRVVSADTVRKSLFGEAKKASDYGKGVYTAQANQLTYEMLIGTGGALLLQEGAVILDATYRRAGDRKAAIEMAKNAGAEIRWIECTLPANLTRIRLEKRLERREGDSDATWEIYQQQSQEFDPLSGDFLKLDTRGSLADVGRVASDWLRDQERRKSL